MLNWESPGEYITENYTRPYRVISTQAPCWHHSDWVPCSMLPEFDEECPQVNKLLSWPLLSVITWLARSPSLQLIMHICQVLIITVYQYIRPSPTTHGSNSGPSIIVRDVMQILMLLSLESVGATHQWGVKQWLPPIISVSPLQLWYTHWNKMQLHDIQV